MDRSWKVCLAVSLTVRIQQGDREAEAELVSRYSAFARRAAAAATNDRALVEDLSQEAIMILIKRLRHGRVAERAIGSFLTGVVRRLAANERRRAQYRRTEPIDNTAAIAISTVATLDHLLHRELLERVRRVIGSLTTRDRVLLSRLYLAGDDREDVRVALNLTPDHFKRVHSRAVARLRKRLEASPG